MAYLLHFRFTMLPVHLYCMHYILVFNALNTTAADMDRLPLGHGTARAISFPMVRATVLWQSVYPDIALHISNCYIRIVWCYFGFSSFVCLK